MEPAKTDLNIYRGSTFGFPVISKGDLNFNTYDKISLKILPAWSFQDSPTMPTAYKELTIANAGIVVAEDGKQLEIVLHSSETEILTFIEGRYILELTKTNEFAPDIVDQLLNGKVTVWG